MEDADMCHWTRQASMFLVLGVALTCFADTITYRGREYSDVVIEELTNQYVVHFPKTGRKKYFSKEEVNSVEVSPEASPYEDGLHPVSTEATSGGNADAVDSPESSSREGVLEEYKRRLRSEERRRRLRIQAQVQFEAAYEHWCRLSDEERDVFLASAIDQAVAAETEKQRTKETVAEKREKNERRSDSVRRNIDIAAVSRDSHISSAYSEAYNDFELDWNRSLRDSHAEDADIMLQLGEYGHADSHLLWEDFYAEKTKRRSADVFGEADAQADQIAREYNSRIAAEQRALRQLAAKAHQIEIRGKTAIQVDASKARRLRSMVNSLLALEEACVAGYEPSLKYRELFSIQSKGVTQRYASFSSSLLRIDWWIDSSFLFGGEMKISVYDAASEELVSAVTSSALPSEHFFMIEEPGDYNIEVEAPAELSYTLEGRELLVFELPALSEE